MAGSGKFPVRAREGRVAPKARHKRRAADVQQLLPLATPPETEPQAAPASSTERLWFCVYLPELPLDASGRRESALAMVEDQQGVHRIVLANEAATAAGVLSGQSANAALALLPELELEERSTVREQQALESLAARLEQFSSFVSIAAADLLLLEIAGSLRLFGGLRPLRKRIALELEQQGFAASLAIAPTPLAASWLARAGRRACIREIANLAPALRNLPLQCLDWPPTTHTALIGMGVTSVGDCLRLPREGFAKRFGASRLIELDRALGRLPDPRVSWRAPERFCVDYEMTEEQSDRELLLAICEELLDAHEKFLLTRQLGTQRIDFCFYHLKAPATKLTMGFTRPDRSATRFAALLGIRFERLSLPEPVIAVRLQGGATQSMKTESARLAFDRRHRQSERYSMSELAERLAARVGDHAVNGVTTVAEHRPQRAWRPQSLSACREAAPVFFGPAIRRPLWLLPEPARLPVEEGLPLHFGRVMLLEGPERLETGWWDEEGIARDYYTAVNPRGMRLWVFRSRGYAADWYLDGIFG